ncbi:MAG: hypothetical protein IKQ10_11155 [Oscillospiraceae bacterium]|nr:hypothetical protein [Oscillospiraceae bacterium]
MIATIGKRSLALLLVIGLLFSLAACGKRPETAASPSPAAGAPSAGVYESGGLKLTVPAEYEAQVTVTTGEDPLFSVSEIASVEAAKSAYPDSYEGAGWLFDITRVTERELHEMLCRDMSGLRVFARDGSGLYYILNTPTDVRIERAGEITQSDIDAWSALSGWAGTAGESFAADNGLTPCRFGNTELEMLLARIAWAGETNYQLGGLEFGLLTPAGTETAAFAAEILERAPLEYVDRTETPDGEYLYMNDLTDGGRYEFFPGEGGCFVRELRGGYAVMYRAAGDADIAEIVARWYEALSACAAPAADEAAYQAAVSAVLDEFAALDQAALENYDEAAHPELPWYTAMIANTVRSNLYYAFYDFDGNGVDELVIAAGDDTYRQPEAIYAFDGTKMVYLCKEQPLGERCALTYFRDGLFAVRGSGSAFSGETAIWRIAADGFGTEMVEIMAYEFKDENTVEYTPKLGNMTAEEYEAGDYLRGFDLPLDYTLFASGG